MLRSGNRTRGVRTVAALAGLCVVVASAFAAGQSPADDGKPTGPPKKRGPEKISGVILKVEQVGRGEPGARAAWRVTINTDVVWRDFVRDQAVSPSKAARTPVAKAAAKGKESVATEGHPRDKELLEVLVIDPRTEITMLYRSSTDEVSEGAATPEGASKAEEAIDAAAKVQDPGKGRPAPKARVLEPMDLKPGHWVDVEYRPEGRKDLARKVAVLRPVGGPDTSPAKEKP